MVTLIIDTANLYCRAKYSMGQLSTSDGRPSGAIYGYFRMVSALERRFEPMHVYHCQENGGKRIRQGKDPEYKGDREPGGFWDHPEHMHALEKWCTSMPGHAWTVGLPHAEADDAIAYIVRQIGAGDKNVICSGDHDMRQLLGPKTVICTHVDKPVYTHEALFLELGISSAFYWMLRALTGDTSDSIPGIHRVGDVTAAKILKECGFDWAKVLQHPKVEPHAERVARNAELVQFLPLERVDTTGREHYAEPDVHTLLEICDEWELTSLRKEIELWEPSAA